MSNEELVLLIQNGDGDAVLQLWEQVEKFVTMQAKRYLSSHVGFYELEDLQQSGFLAMLRAAKEYSTDKETGFLTYFDYWLRREFQRADGINKRQNEPLREAISLDRPIKSDDPNGDTIADLQPDPRDPIAEVERRIYLEQLRQQLNKALATLPEEQRAAIIHRYRDGLTLEQTGAAMQRTTYEARKLEWVALETLRKKRRELEQFIDDRTPFYGKIGIRQFASDRESIVEKCVFTREKIRREVER